MSSYLIIGCGHFGSRAARRLLEKNPHSKITVVDRDEKPLGRVLDLPVERVVADGLVHLDRFLMDGPFADYIIPAVPCHLAVESILSQLKPLGAKRTTIPLLQGLPHPSTGKTGDLYTSHADFLCPDDCPEPSRHCTVTRKKRSKPLFELLTDLKGPFDSRVIRSHQLGLGIGGFQPEELIDLTGRIKKRMGSNCLFLISTACRCHGVISALSI
jgi:TrkA-N domain